MNDDTYIAYIFTADGIDIAPCVGATRQEAVSKAQVLLQVGDPKASLTIDPERPGDRNCIVTDQGWRPCGIVTFNDCNHKETA